MARREAALVPQIELIRRLLARDPAGDDAPLLPLLEEALIDLARGGLTERQFGLLLAARVELERYAGVLAEFPDAESESCLEALARLEAALTPKAARPH